MGEEYVDWLYNLKERVNPPKKTTIKDVLNEETTERQKLSSSLKRIEELQRETLDNLKELLDILLIPAEVELKKGNRNGRER